MSRALPRLLALALHQAPPPPPPPPRCRRHGCSAVPYRLECCRPTGLPTRRHRRSRWLGKAGSRQPCRPRCRQPRRPLWRRRHHPWPRRPPPWAAERQHCLQGCPARRTAGRRARAESATTVSRVRVRVSRRAKILRVRREENGVRRPCKMCTINETERNGFCDWARACLAVTARTLVFLSVLRAVRTKARWWDASNSARAKPNP